MTVVSSRGPCHGQRELQGQRGWGVGSVTLWGDGESKRRGDSSGEGSVHRLVTGYGEQNKGSWCFGGGREELHQCFYYDGESEG